MQRMPIRDSDEKARQLFFVRFWLFVAITLPLCTLPDRHELVMIEDRMDQAFERSSVGTRAVAAVRDERIGQFLPESFGGGRFLVIWAA